MFLSPNLSNNDWFKNDSGYARSNIRDITNVS